jgi:hypothetical protein
MADPPPIVAVFRTLAGFPLRLGSAWFQPRTLRGWMPFPELVLDDDRGFGQLAVTAVGLQR